MFIHVPIKVIYSPLPLALMFWLIMFVNENEKMEDKFAKR